MKIRNRILAGATAIASLGLAACSGGSQGTQDGGSSNNGSGASSRTFHARAVDGYLAGANVYVDVNGNGQLDAFEPRAITDVDGYFSYNHKTGIDYCATGGLKQHCLRGAIDANETVLIRVTGGYDTVTQLPFKGVLSLRSSELNRDDLRLITPVTSMVADSLTPEQKFQALVDAGVFEGTMDDDPLLDVANASRAQMAAILSRIFGEVGNLSLSSSSFEDVEHAAWASGYIAIAGQIGTIEGTSFGDAFSDPAVVEAAAREAIFAALHPGRTLTNDFQLTNPASYSHLVQFAADLVGLNEELIESVHGAASIEELQAILRVQMIAAERALANPHDPELSDLSDWIRNQLAQGNRLGADLTALGEADMDLSALIDPAFNFDPASNSVSASAKIPAEAASTFAALVNTSFGVAVNEPDEQGAALFFLSGDANARSGEIDVCVRYTGDDGDFDTTSSTDPNGALLVGGHWSLLDDHTLTLGVEVAGGVRPLLLKAVAGSGSERDYRFDFGRDLSTWSGSMPSAFAPGSVPANDAACKAALIERFGSIG
ncbi:hypothetical protein JM946_08175 [Steroidobacter sp. S1-65]|uniref:S-layer homology domain-containing protein n=1 Tax=Steroidobacter gossypii TaxID=2805490 RepID=A0ABS1WUR8_9GAMM|nr:hypothetical protein [Steroidobacter gossypii]MBM0104720.1 hypothetical protein [Steroidobacter gossypii]